jgi:hypothetical protein
MIRLAGSLTLESERRQHGETGTSVAFVADPPLANRVVAEADQLLDQIGYDAPTPAIAFRRYRLNQRCDPSDSHRFV